MKKNLTILGVIGFVLVIGLVVISCTEKKGSPSAVVREYYKAIEKGDMAALEKVSAEGEAPMVKLFASMTKGSVAARGGIKSIEETIDGDRATITTTFKDDSTEKLALLNQNGEWKITLEK